MANLAQSVERKAFSVAIDAALKHLNKDREKGLLQIVDLAEKFMGDNFRKEAYDGARKMIQDPDNKWMHYVNRLLDETDPHVAKMTALKETTTRIIQPVNPKIRTTVRVEVTRRKRQQRIELPRQVT